MVFTSHLENKLSYHIILPNICLKNEKALDKFYREVMENIEQELDINFFWLILHQNIVERKFL